MEEYQLPQITIGARKKGQLYLGDLSNVMIWVRYNTHTLTHNTDTHNANKVKKARNIRVKNNGRLEELLVFFKKN